MTQAFSGKYVRLNLQGATFIHGAGVPRVVTLNSCGQVIPDEESPATDINPGDVIVFPGLVNSHDHLDFNLYPALGDPPYVDVDEWASDVHQNSTSIVSAVEGIAVDVRRFWGLLKNLSCGVTMVMDHSSPYHVEAYDLPVRIVRRFRFVHRADTRWAWLRGFQRRGDGPLVFHVAEGTSRKVARRSARFIRRVKGRGPLIGVHGIALDPNSASHLAALVWCPVSNLYLFGRTADVAALKGVTEILFGTDASISAQGTIWDHLRIARECSGLSDKELFDSVTTTANRVWGQECTGDMVVARRRHPDPWEALYQVTPADICMVISQRRVALISESFYQQLGMTVWNKNCVATRIGNVDQRIYCPDSSLLTRLASIDGAPISVRHNP